MRWNSWSKIRDFKEMEVKYLLPLPSWIMKQEIVTYKARINLSKHKTT